MKTGAAGAGGENAGGQSDPEEPSAPDAAPRARILAPASGTILALDPDIPPEHQRVWFEAAGGQALGWRMDSKRLGVGTRLAWLPWPGRHTVELIDAKGRLLDTVHIEVRGAGIK